MPGGTRRRLLGWISRHPRLQLLVLFVPPAGWFGVVYFGSLALLLLTAFWTLDPDTARIVHTFNLDNFQKLATGAYPTIIARTIFVAAVVTLVDALIAFPIAFFMARVASPRTRAALTVAVVLPLWASYLVRVYAWRVILSDSGLIDWVFARFGVQNVGSLFGISDLSMTIVFIYLWLPYMILPIFAGLERIPGSYLEASADLGGHPLTTFRRVILPLAIPAVAAGSIFTFSLTLGDYITPSLVSNSQFIGNVIFGELGVAGNVPFAAAFAMVPIVIMAAYLLVMRRLGAFEAL